MEYKRVNKKHFIDNQHPDRTGIKRLVKDLHEINPGYIFLTDTTATAWGLVFKESWREAYPGEAIPKFYRVEPKSLKNIPKYEESKKKFEEYLQKRGIKSEDKIVVFDEEYIHGTSINLVKEAFENENGLYGNHHFKNITYIEGNEGVMEKIEGKITPSKNPKEGFNKYRIQHGVQTYQRDKDNQLITDTFRISLKERNKEVLYPLKFTGNLIHNPSKEHKETYQEIKAIGAEIGEEIHEEIQRKNSLEAKISGTTFVLTFVGSLFFIGSNITGNAISNFSNSTNSFIGVGLLIVSLITGTFWIKRK